MDYIRAEDDGQVTFEEKCERIQPVFDYFHIIKNFTDKVVSEVGKVEQHRYFEGDNIISSQVTKEDTIYPYIKAVHTAEEG